MPGSIFSTYRTGENRVTASILAVLRSLALHRTERLLGALMERSDFQLVSFQNQVAKGGKGVPDASITASCYVLSSRLSDEFHNGEHYYQFTGSELWVPKSDLDRPSREFLEWHGDTVFRA